MNNNIKVLPNDIHEKITDVCRTVEDSDVRNQIVLEIIAEKRNSHEVESLHRE